MRHRKKLLLALAAAAVCGFALGSAAMVIAQGGTSAIRGEGTAINAVKAATSSGAQFNISGSGSGDDAADLPRARHRLALTKPGGTLVIARLSAVTACFGAGGRMHARVRVHDNNNGDAVVAEMPYIGHIDSSFGGDGHEGHAVESSITLPPGNYDFQVRISVVSLTGETISCNIPAWHYTVERIV
jgi:hypothetical protein